MVKTMRLGIQPHLSIFSMLLSNDRGSDLFHFIEGPFGRYQREDNAQCDNCEGDDFVLPGFILFGGGDSEVDSNKLLGKGEYCCREINEEINPVRGEDGGAD